ncbi:MAG: hypothetical protein J6I53_03120 [Treponema sp.]|nr:hypothetical protein [Treponema sp.]
MKKTFCLIFILALFLSVTSCATADGTALVTGKQRPATNPESVVVYTEAPAKYEIIGIVTASSDSGWTEQGDLDYAMAELKKQAAKIGANGVILESVGTSNSGGVIGYGFYVPITAKNVSGKAIYVFNDEN